MKISALLDQIDLGSLALPEFQRGYVWNREQVRGLMQSLYRKHPVGSLLVWLTRTEEAHVRGDGSLQPGYVKLLLDGQQRITSLYGIIRGQPPRFFDGNTQTFTGLYCHLEEEIFEFYAPLKMRDDPLWVDVTRLMQQGQGEIIPRFYSDPSLQSRFPRYFNRLAAIEAIKEIDLHVEEVAGEDKTLDVVVEIFNKVNSGGTKLSKGDLALAKVCAGWPEARSEMKKRLEKWRRAGFNFRLEWLLRCINTIVTGEALFNALERVSAKDFETGLGRAEHHVDRLLNMIATRLGFDHDRVLGSPYSFPLLVRYLDRHHAKIPSQRERDRLLYWYVHTFLWGRYAGSTETVLNRDLALIEEADGALDRLIDQLRLTRRDLRLHADDFLGWSIGARFYPLLYMLTRAGHARDWGSDIELSAHLLGHLNRLEVHHIFPKDVLYKHGYERAEVNALANFTFLTQETNLEVLNRRPEDYFPEYVRRNPGAVESHWIPMDPDLWKIESYTQFLAARRELLAKAANNFLASLYRGAVPETPFVDVLEPKPAYVPGGVTGEEEEQLLLDTAAWVEQQGLPGGEFLYELTDAGTGEPLAVLDLAWPEGLQPGLSQPAALLLNEEEGTEEIVNRAGYRFFTDVAAFRQYVNTEVLAIEGIAFPQAQP